ncbi:MAG: preprotein translocase subunit YajC [Clostridia bacterium]|nr:preprotein translocase subunit YajC [Clostridia bacterium]
MFGNGSFGMILYFVVIIAVFYFFLIRPQKKREKEQKNLLNSIKKGDQIITIGGFYGKVVSVKEDVVTIMMGDNKVKLEKAAIKTVTKASNDTKDEEDDIVVETLTPPTEEN